MGQCWLHPKPQCNAPATHHVMYLPTKYVHKYSASMPLMDGSFTWFIRPGCATPPRRGRQARLRLYPWSTTRRTVHLLLHDMFTASFEGDSLQKRHASGQPAVIKSAVRARRQQQNIHTWPATYPNLPTYIHETSILANAIYLG